jgi:acid phosphatase family membrane protein YuiD
MTVTASFQPRRLLPRLSTILPARFPIHNAAHTPQLHLFHAHLETGLLAGRTGAGDSASTASQGGTNPPAHAITATTAVVTTTEATTFSSRSTSSWVSQLHPSPIRTRSERGAPALVHCYGVESFAHRTLSTARYLPPMTRQGRRIRHKWPSPSDVAQVGRPAGKVTSLSTSLARQREWLKAAIRELKTKHAAFISTPGVASTSGTTVPALLAEIVLRAGLQELPQERDQHAQDAQVWRRQAESTRTTPEPCKKNSISHASSRCRSS